MSNKIKPCTCGGNAQVKIKYTVGEPILYKLVCEECFKGTQYASTEAKAIEVWNRSVDNGKE